MKGDTASEGDVTARVRVVAVVPAHDEGDRIVDTVEALRSIASRIVVVDDGSVDDTGRLALRAGASVICSDRRRGKGAAAEAGVRWALDRGADLVLLADADLGRTARRLFPLVDNVSAGEADLAIGVLPAQAGGGFGLVKRWARRAIARRCGFSATAPLSGQRALTASGARAVLPFAPGFGLEARMTIDGVRAGLRVREVPVDVAHRPTGRTPQGFAHRARQALDIARGLGERRRGDQS